MHAGRTDRIVSLAFFVRLFCDFDLFLPSIQSARPSSAASPPPAGLLRSVSMVSDGTGPIAMSPITSEALRPDGKVKRVWDLAG